MQCKAWTLRGHHKSGLHSHRDITTDLSPFNPGYQFRGLRLLQMLKDIDYMTSSYVQLQMKYIRIHSNSMRQNILCKIHFNPSYGTIPPSTQRSGKNRKK